MLFFNCECMSRKNLIVVAGPTGVGKTVIAIHLAKHFGTEIISADSRQVYLELNIGTAKPDFNQLASVPHHLVGHVSIHEAYSAGKFESEAITILEHLFQQKDVVIMVGGTGMFIDAVINGLDVFPEVDDSVRLTIRELYRKNGLNWLQKEVQEKDPVYFSVADIHNPNRLLRALEVCISSGKTYSGFRTGKTKKRDFETIKIFINESRDQLYEKINNRTLKMLENGWLEEAKSVYQWKNLNALNTVGYKELFDYLGNILSLEDAKNEIQKNTRRYAKRQITWFANDADYTEFAPGDATKIISFLEMILNAS